MGRTRMIAIAGCIVAGATGCTWLAGVDDIVYGPETETSPTEPGQNAKGSADAQANADASASADAEAEAEAVAVADAGADADADARAEAEAEAGPPPVVADDPCTAADFAAHDRRGPLQLRVVTFPAGPAADARYAPSCMRIRKGQTVTFLGNFATYPLEAMGPDANASPIAPTGGGGAATFTFPEKGRFAFGSAGTPTMRGAIDVK